MECLEEKSIRIRTKRSTTVVGTSRCARCGGFMVEEWSTDLERNDFQRCVQCGERLDPVILENRRRQLFNDDTAWRRRLPIGT